MGLFLNETKLKSVLPSFKFLWQFFDMDIFVHYGPMCNFFKLMHEG